MKEKMEPKVTKHLCPLCKWPLMLARGDSINPDNGWMLWCPSIKCPAQEVMGHGRTEERALAVIQAKFEGASMAIENEAEEDQPIVNTLTPVMVEEPPTTGPMPVKRGRGRPPKVAKVVEVEEELPL